MSPVPKKIERVDSLVSPGMVCYAEKQVKPFWFSSLDQIVQFDTIIFCRTFKNYFGQFVWIEKKKKKSHYNGRVSLHEAPTNNQQENNESDSERFVSPIRVENSCPLEQDVIVAGPSKPKSPKGIEGSFLESLRASLKEEITSEIKNLLIESQKKC